nr:hypothetical protein SHINE37_70025 [Rhizobiaceae bacterium]
MGPDPKDTPAIPPKLGATNSISSHPCGNSIMVSVQCFYFLRRLLRRSRSVAKWHQQLQVLQVVNSLIYEPVIKNIVTLAECCLLK